METCWSEDACSLTDATSNAGVLPPDTADCAASRKAVDVAVIRATQSVMTLAVKKGLTTVGRRIIDSSKSEGLRSHRRCCCRPTNQSSLGSAFLVFGHRT